MNKKTLNKYTYISFCTEHCVLRFVLMQTFTNSRSESTWELLEFEGAVVFIYGHTGHLTPLDNLTRAFLCAQFASLFLCTRSHRQLLFGSVNLNQSNLVKQIFFLAENT